MKRLLTVLLVTLCLSVAGPRSADGHAQLRASAPASGALLDTRPDHVRLFFHEPVGLLQLRWLQPSGTVARVAEYASTSHHFQNIARGVIDLSDVVYYLSIIGACLTAAQASISARRW